MRFSLLALKVERVGSGPLEPKPTKPSNVAKVLTFKKGDIEAGFNDAEVVVEGRYTTSPVHQAYLEPHACLCSYNADGQVTIYSSSQGHFMVRAYCAKLLGLDISNVRAVPMKSAAASAARRWSIWSPWPLPCPRRPAGR